MPTQGSNIPVLTAEKIWLDKDGRGLYAHDDGTAVKAGTWVNPPYVVGASNSGICPSGKALPASGTTAWLKITLMSGTAGSGFTGYIPVFSENILGF